MIQSMTGFGRAVVELDNRKVTVEVKSLNSKQLDLSLRIPSLYRESEMEIRSLAANRLERGKVELSVNLESMGALSVPQLNQSAISVYYAQIKASVDALGISLPENVYEMILRMPEVIKSEPQALAPQENAVLLQAVNQAIDRLIEFRRQEGAVLATHLTQKITSIGQLLIEVDAYEGERVERIRTRISEALLKVQEVDYDKNRLEQEMIYYIEKLDINEEKIRLKNHLKYFVDTLQEEKNGQGKKLGFIAQEIGREINTLGSKANQHEMQRIVVNMKDELEQIKEQVLNVM